jgi:hypothetical protein
VIAVFNQLGEVIDAREAATSLCVGSVRGVTLAFVKVSEWELTLPDTVAMRAARIGIAHSSSGFTGLLAVGTRAVFNPDSAFVLPYASRDVSASAAIALEDTKRVRVEARLSANGSLRARVRAENGDGLLGFKVTTTIDLLDQDRRLVRSLEPKTVDRPAKPEGGARCTDDAIFATVPAADVSRTKSIAIRVADAGRTATVRGENMGFVCSDVELRLPDIRTVVP